MFSNLFIIWLISNLFLSGMRWVLTACLHFQHDLSDISSFFLSIWNAMFILHQNAWVHRFWLFDVYSCAVPLDIPLVLAACSYPAGQLVAYLYFLIFTDNVPFTFCYPVQLLAIPAHCFPGLTSHDSMLF